MTTTSAPRKGRRSSHYSLPQLVDEGSFQAAVLEVAKLTGWRTLHIRPARRADGSWRTPIGGSGRGFPDLLLLKGNRILVRELKVGRNKLTPEQADWLAAFEGAGVDAGVWRPDDWSELLEVLGS